MLFLKRLKCNLRKAIKGNAIFFTIFEANDMDIKILSLRIECASGTVLVPCSNHITFFYGNAGVGKTTLLNLISYSLGQDIIRTRAVNENVFRVCLNAVVAGRQLFIERKIGSNLVVVNDGNIKKSFVAKSDSGSNMTLSNYFYELSGIQPIEMLRGRTSKSVNISFSNFMWFSYLRQEELDNTLFYLDDKSNNFKRYASNYVLRTLFDDSRIIRKEIEQKVNRISEQLENIQSRQAILRELFSVSSILNIDIGNEIAKKYRMVTVFKQELEKSVQKVPQDRAQLQQLLAYAKNIGRYEAEIRYLREISKLQATQKKYHYLYGEYKKEQEIWLSKIKNLGRKDFVGNIELLQKIFKETLLEVDFPGFTEKDVVIISTDTFIPAAYSSVGKFLFDYRTLSSSGIKTIFKICYALSIHCFIRKQSIVTLMPSFVIIDTPMKNISERIDKRMCNKLYSYLYRLFSRGGALYGVQLIVVDKELPEEFKNNDVIYKMLTKESPLIPL